MIRETLKVLLGVSLLIAFILLQPLQVAHSDEPGLALTIRRFLLGDIWHQGERCGTVRTDNEISQDDELIRSMLNGSLARKISHDWSVASTSIELLDKIKLRASESLRTFCLGYGWGYADTQDLQLADNYDANQTACTNEMDNLIKLITYVNEKRNPSSDPIFDFELWQQLNTFARPASGRPYNRLIWVGDYQGCLDVGRKLQAERKTSGTRYCFGLIGRLFPDTARWTSDNLRIGNSYEGYKSGICLPASCSANLSENADDFIEKVEHLLNLIYTNDYLRMATDATTFTNETSLLSGSSYRLLDVFCPPSEDSRYHRLISTPLGDNLMRSGVNFTLLFIVPCIWLSALIYATRKHAKSGKCDQNLNVVARSFNLATNLKDFLEANKRSKSLAELDGIKTLAMLWLVMTHMYLIIYNSITDVQDFRKRTSLFSAFLLNGQHSVTIFFIMGGILVGKKYLNRKQEGYFSLITARYVRLAPMFILCYIYIRTFGHLVSSGPLWDHGVSHQSTKHQCRKESWLVPILLLSNFIGADLQCIQTSWYIANDMHIYLFIPILLHIYRRSRVAGRLVIVGSFVFTHFTHFRHWFTATNYDFDHMMYEPISFGAIYVLDRLQNDYIEPVGRLGTYFFGVLIADLLAEPEGNFGKQKIFKGTLFLVGLVFFQIFWTTVLPDYLKMWASSYFHKKTVYPLIRLLFELGCGTLIYCLARFQVDSENDNEPDWMRAILEPSKRFLSLPIWNIMAKLNYSIMLTHIFIIVTILGSQPTLAIFSWPYYTQMLLYALIFIYPIGFLQHILVEIPLNKLISCWMD